MFCPIFSCPRPVLLGDEVNEEVDLIESRQTVSRVPLGTGSVAVPHKGDQTLAVAFEGWIALAMVLPNLRWHLANIADGSRASPDDVGSSGTSLVPIVSVSRIRVPDVTAVDPDVAL